MRNRWTRWVGLVVGLLVMGGTGVLLPDAAAAPDCGPRDRFPATLLVRPDAGWPFVGLESDGADPYIDPSTNRTIVPMRSLFTALAPGEANATWDEPNRTALFQYRDHVMAIRYPAAGTTAYSVLLDGRDLPIHTFICDGRVYGPARYVVEALGIGIRYHGDGVVIIDPATVPEDTALPGPAAAATAAPEQSASSPATQATRSGPAATATPCEEWPDRLLAYVTAPRATMREAARSAACHLLQAQ